MSDQIASLDGVHPSAPPLTNPLDALVLPRVLRWVAVVFRQKSKCGHLDKEDGRPWTRIPAKDLAAQLEREEGLTVSVRRIQRSLCRLVDEGHLARQQRTKWWGQRDYWYSWTDAEWDLQKHRPTALARGSSKATPHTDRSRRPEASPATAQYLGLPLPTQTTLKTERTRATASLNGTSACDAPQDAPKQETAQPSAWRSQTVLETLKRVAKRAEARGFGQVATPVVATAEQESWIEGQFRYTRLASGHLIKDALSTAPLR